MIDALVKALEGAPGRVELRGLLSTLRVRFKRLGPCPAREALVADGKILAQSVEGEATAEQLAAAVDVVRRWSWSLMSSDEVLGRPVCANDCPDRIVLVDEPGVRCALCDGPVTRTIAVAQRGLTAALELAPEAPTVLGDTIGGAA